MLIAVFGMSAVPAAAQQKTPPPPEQAREPQTPEQQAQAAAASDESASARTGGASYEEESAPLPRVVVPGRKAVLMDDGLAAAPAEAPEAVKAMIWAANELQQMPYRYGGGHARVQDTGYDCSGTVSYALIAGGVLKAPLDSSSFMSWGKAGKGKWVTVYTNPGHAYVVIAGLRLDTSSAGAGGGKGPRWRAAGRAMKGFEARHPRKL